MDKYIGCLLYTSTQRAQEDLGALIPGARVLRMDADTTAAKFSQEKLLKSFEEKEYDILIGTQMIAKGLDFERVSLVGVLSTDQLLYGGDYKGYERAFSLLTQVAGRCGRGSIPGRAYIQTPVSYTHLDVYKRQGTDCARSED